MLLDYSLYVCGYTGSDRITGKSGHDVIAHEKIGKRYRMKFVYSRFSFREIRIWKFIKYTWTWLASLEINNQSERSIISRRLGQYLLDICAVIMLLKFLLWFKIFFDKS